MLPNRPDDKNTTPVLQKTHAALPEEKLEEYTKYIRNNSGPNVWRANPNDPYIYVSFNAADMVTYMRLGDYPQYLMPPLAKMYNCVFSQFSPEVIAFLKSIIQEEFIDPAKLPIRFLPDQVDTNTLRSKNVLFITGLPVTAFEMYKQQIMDVSTSSYRATLTVEDNTMVCDQADAKIMILPKLRTPQDLTPYLKRCYLHELMHGLVEAKHFKKLGKEDEESGPFADNGELNSLHTVMGYNSSNPLLQEKIREQNWNYHVLPAPSGNPEVDRKQQIIWEAIPQHLTPLDLMAAKDFKKSWENRHLKQPEKQWSASNSSLLYQSAPEADEKNAACDALARDQVTRRIP